MRTELKDPSPSPERPKHQFTIPVLVCGPAPSSWRDPERRAAYDALREELDAAAAGTPHATSLGDTTLGRARHEFQIQRLMWAHRQLAGDPRVSPTHDWDTWLDPGVPLCREACCRP